MMLTCTCACVSEPQAMRQHHKTRKHLQHNQRLQEWQQEQEMRQFAADAARIRGRAGQQLDYFKRVQVMIAGRTASLA